MGQRALVMAVAIALATAACSGGGDGGGADVTTAAPTTVVPVVVTVGDPVVVGTGEFTNYNTSIAVGGPDGSVVAAVWNDYDEENVVERPFVVTSPDGGATFAEPVLIDPEDPYLAYPELAVDDAGTIFAVTTRYADASASDGWPALYASTDGGATFEQLADLPDVPSVAFAYTGAAVAVTPDGSSLVMAWAHEGEGGDDPSGAYATVSADGGRTFSDPELVAALDDPYVTRVRPFASADGLGVATPISIPISGAPKPTPANPNPIDSEPALGIVLADSDGRFAEPILVEPTDDFAAFQGPGADAADGTTHVAWWGATEGIGTIWYASAHDDQFDEAVALLDEVTLGDPSTGGATAVELALDGRGVVWALASVMVDETPELRLVRVVDGEAEIVDGASVPRVSSGVEYDVAARPDGGVVLVWFDDSDVLVRVVEA